MSGAASSSKELIYTFHLVGSRSGHKQSTSGKQQAVATIPRIARLMALAIRFQGLVHNEGIKDYAELARLGAVTRGRMTQIMQLLHLAPDIQEQLLFSAEPSGLNERNLRAVVRPIDWSEQRRIFQALVASRASR